MRVELKKYPDYRPTGIEYLDRVPKAWQLRPLKTVLKQKRGAIKAGPFGTQLLASEMLSQGPVKVLNQRNVIDADLIAGENYVSATKFADLKAFEVFPGDILLTSRGTIGRTCLVLSLNEPAILHPCLIRIQPDERLVGAKYLMMLLGGVIVQDQLQILSNATTIAAFPSMTFSSFYKSFFKYIRLRKPQK